MADVLLEFHLNAEVSASDSKVAARDPEMPVSGSELLASDSDASVSDFESFNSELEAFFVQQPNIDHANYFFPSTHDVPDIINPDKMVEYSRKKNVN